MSFIIETIFTTGVDGM